MTTQTITVTRHRKLPNGSYELIVDVGGEQLAFAWGPVPVDEKEVPTMTDEDYEAMQLREAKLLAEAAQAPTVDAGVALASEGQTL